MGGKNGTAAARAQTLLLDSVNKQNIKQPKILKINYQFSYEYQARIAHTSDRGIEWNLYDDNSIFMGRIFELFATDEIFGKNKKNAWKGQSREF